MRAKTATKVLDSAEWDFRAIPDEEIDAAVEYEYYREDAEIRSQVEQWLSQPFRKWEPLKLSNEDREARLLAHFSRADRDLVELEDHRIIPPVEVVWQAGSFPTLKEAYFSAPRFEDLPLDVQVAMLDSFPFTQTTLIEWVANFPTPWLRLKGRRFKAERTSAVVPLSDPPYEDLRISKAQEKQRTASYHSIRIDWDAPDEHIIEGFAEWLESARPKQIKPTETRGRSKRKGLLKSLSAFRLHRAIGYEAAQDLLWKILDGKAKHPLLPIYDERKHWDRARKAARDFLAERKILSTLKPPQELEIDFSGLLDS